MIHISGCQWGILLGTTSEEAVKLFSYLSEVKKKYYFTICTPALVSILSFRSTFHQMQRSESSEVRKWNLVQKNKCLKSVKLHCHCEWLK